MKKIVGLVVFFLLIVLIVRGWWINQTSPLQEKNGSKSIIITKGKTLDKIATQLEEQGLIKSSFAFKLLVSQKGLADKLQAGTFKLSPTMTAEEVAQKLTKPEEVWVTLLEGWRVEEMAEEINSKLQISNDKFLKIAKEGYMFPDTYLFPHEVETEQIVSAMKKNFEDKFSDELRVKIKSKGLTETQGVILASIIEREARSQKAREEVSSILLKRFKIDMGLNADATLQYALVPRGSESPPESGWWKRHLTAEDKKIDSPYNTYLYRGLPPAPISNPSLSSLQAVASADPKTPFLYYYHDSKGNSHYAKTLDEHNQNVANNP